MTRLMKNSAIIFFIVASLAVHTLLMAGLSYFESPPKTSSVAVEVFYDSSDTSDKKHFVTDPQDELEKLSKALQERAKHLSKYTRRVERERVARKTGKTANRQGAASAAQAQAKKEVIENQNGLSPTFDLREELKTANKWLHVGQGLGESTIGEYIPHVQQGSFTALNTDQSRFYTFFYRINEQIRPRWVQNVRSAAQRLKLKNQLHPRSAQTYVTHLEVVLDKEGEVIRSIIHKSSGNVSLDQAALAAFLQAAPLHNPPTEMVKADGLVHLEYAFHLQMNPRYFASGG